MLVLLWKGETLTKTVIYIWIDILWGMTVAKVCAYIYMNIQYYVKNTVTFICIYIYSEQYQSWYRSRYTWQNRSEGPFCGLNLLHTLGLVFHCHHTKKIENPWQWSVHAPSYWKKTWWHCHILQHLITHVGIRVLTLPTWIWWMLFRHSQQLSYETKNKNGDHPNFTNKNINLKVVFCQLPRFSNGTSSLSRNSSYVPPFIPLSKDSKFSHFLKVKVNLKNHQGG